MEVAILLRLTARGLRRASGHRGLERLVDVGLNVFDILQTDGKADVIWCHSGGEQLLFAQLGVSS